MLYLSVETSVQEMKESCRKVMKKGTEKQLKREKKNSNAMQWAMLYKRQPLKGSKKKPEAENDRKSGYKRGQLDAPAVYNEPARRTGENGQNENSSEKANKNEAETEQRGSNNSEKR